MLRSLQGAPFCIPHPEAGTPECATAPMRRKKRPVVLSLGRLQRRPQARQHQKAPLKKNLSGAFLLHRSCIVPDARLVVATTPTPDRGVIAMIRHASYTHTMIIHDLPSHARVSPEPRSLIRVTSGDVRRATNRAAIAQRKVRACRRCSRSGSCQCIASADPRSLKPRPLLLPETSGARPGAA